jgi:DNA helicase HerA-like ATPase
LIDATDPISDAFTGRPRPLVILDMSSEGLDLGGHDLDDHDEDNDLQGLLESTTIKARILRQACGLLERAAARAYKDKKELLNTLVVLDEARDYAAPPRPDGDPEVTALSRALTQYARQTRKLGLGWFFTTQTPSDLNPGIWDQLAVRVVGYGLGGSDLRRIEEHVDDPEALRLYRSFPHPRSTDPRQYPFMLLGTVSPLSFTKAPVFLSVYTSFTNFQRDNHHWIRQQIRPTRG